MALNVKVGGDWKDVASGTKLRVKQNGTLGKMLQKVTLRLAVTGKNFM